MTSFTRRLALKLIGLGSAWLGLSKVSSGQTSAAVSETTTVSWKNTHDRVWLSGEIWANPMEDWRVVDGAAECQTMGGDRNLHLITHQLSDATAAIDMSVTVRRVDIGRQDGGVGFRIGIQSDINEHRSNCFARNGIDAGLIDGQLMLGRKRVPVEADITKDVGLRLAGRPLEGGYELKLVASDSNGKVLGRITQRVAREAIAGNVALVAARAPAYRRR